MIDIFIVFLKFDKIYSDNVAIAWDLWHFTIQTKILRLDLLFLFFFFLDLKFWTLACSWYSFSRWNIRYDRISNMRFEWALGYVIMSHQDLSFTKRNVKLGLWVLASHKQGKMTGYNLRMLFSRLSGSLGDMLSLIALTIPFHSYRFSRVLYALCNLICPP